jgi:hypothetical protein
MGKRTVVVAAITGALIAGCAAPETTATSRTSADLSAGPSRTLSPPASSTAPTSSSSAAASPAAAGGPAPPERCHTPHLAGRVRLLEAAAGNRYATLILTNRSDETCRTFGYVGMQLTGPGGDELPTRVIREPEPAPHRVVLRPGQSAYTHIHWTVVPGAGEPAAGPCAPRPTRLLVIPPDERTQLAAGWSGGAVCERGRIFTTALGPGTGQRH